MASVNQDGKPSNGFLASVVLTLFGVVLAAALIEAVSRLVLDDGMQFDLEMWKYARDIKISSDDPKIGHEHRPLTSGFYMGAPVSINSAGYRDREYPLLKPAGGVRVMMLGDSLTFGWGVKVEDTFADQLEKILNKGAIVGEFEVINAGVGNYNTSMEVTAFMRNGYKFNPDIVVLNYFINDAEPTPKRAKSSFTEYSYAAVMLWGALDTVSRMYFGKADWKSYYSGLYGDAQPGWKQSKEAIAQLADYCKRKGIKLLLVNLPELHELSSYPFENVNSKVEEVAGQLGVPYDDMLPVVQAEPPQTLWVSPTDAHPNAKADAIIAAEIASALGRFFPELVTQ